MCVLFIDQPNVEDRELIEILIVSIDLVIMCDTNANKLFIVIFKTLSAVTVGLTSNEPPRFMSVWCLSPNKTAVHLISQLPARLMYALTTLSYVRERHGGVGSEE